MLNRRKSLLGLIFAVCVVLIGTANSQVKHMLAGVYCLNDVREVGSCFELRTDHRFRYFLTYGAYDERSEGTWRIKGSEILLDSPAYDRLPSFSFSGTHPAEAEVTDRRVYVIVVLSASGNGMAGVDVRVTCGSKVSEGYTQYFGYVTSCTQKPKEIQLGFFALGVAYQSVSVIPTQSEDRALHFKFDTGDLGQKSFAGVKLQVDAEDAFVLTYENSPAKDLEGQRFRYQKIRAK